MRSFALSFESREHNTSPSVKFLRNSSAKAKGQCVRRSVVQYHFTNWNDYKAPERSKGLLRLLNRLRELAEFNDGLVRWLRSNRNIQCVFIQKATAEWHLFGYTDMDFEQLKEHYQDLLEPANEVYRLERTLETPAKCSFAANEDNLMKN
ncbi:unnamed protein product [Cylicostephanus goldi]|uniref:Tyrosine-protein phosphatase domain-containing protein n=1 Tax=Cylicostephanus goldi TaxID=71465 RepID=A0A3P6QTK3_CYLGO|nr:unnamed protein product [Cylicostephanus goldi]